MAPVIMCLHCVCMTAQAELRREWARLQRAQDADAERTKLAEQLQVRCLNIEANAS